MEFTHILKELYPAEIIEVRGNADALAVTLKKDTDIKAFIQKLKDRFKNLDEPEKIFLRLEDEEGIETLILK